MKFSPHGGEVLVEVTREPERVRFTVYDQGPGIRAGEAERIFEPLVPRGGAPGRGAAAGLGPGPAGGAPDRRGARRAGLGREPAAHPAGERLRHFTGSKFVLEIPVRPVRPAAGRRGSAPAAIASGEGPSAAPTPGRR